MSVAGSCELHRNFSPPIKFRGFGHGNLRSFQAAQFVAVLCLMYVAIPREQQRITFSEVYAVCFSYPVDRGRSIPTQPAAVCVCACVCVCVRT